MGSCNLAGSDIKPVGYTRRGHAILRWRYTGGMDRYGEQEQQALIDGVGWCLYSLSLSAILIRGEWVTY